MAIEISTKEKIHFTNQWCKSIGIKSRDLDSHPTIDDCIFLINFRTEIWQYLDRSEQATWGAYWNTVYHKQKNLGNKAYQKFKIIAESALFKQEKQQLRLATIKALRLKTQANAKEQNLERI